MVLPSLVILSWALPQQKLTIIMLMNYNNIETHHLLRKRLFWESIWPWLTMLWIIRNDIRLPIRDCIHGHVMTCEKPNINQSELQSLLDSASIWATVSVCIMRLLDLLKQQVRTEDTLNSWATVFASRKRVMVDWLPVTALLTEQQQLHVQMCSLRSTKHLALAAPLIEQQQQHAQINAIYV